MTIESNRTLYMQHVEKYEFFKRKNKRQKDRKAANGKQLPLFAGGEKDLTKVKPDL